MKNSETTNQLHEEIQSVAYNLYKKLLPKVKNSYGKKYQLLDRINGIDDFENDFFLVVLEAVCSFNSLHSPKEAKASIIEWKKCNGKKQKHKMKIETFVIEQLKKELDNKTNLKVQVKKGDYSETMSYSQFVKKRAFYKKNGYEIEFTMHDIPMSHLKSDDDDNRDCEFLRYGLQDEINDMYRDIDSDNI